MKKKFSEVSAVQRVELGRYVSSVDAGWTIGGRPNGGYLLAIVSRAILDHSQFADVISTSVHFLFSPESGVVDVQVEQIRVGKSYGHFEGRLFQNGRCALTVIAIVGNLAKEQNPFWRGQDIECTVAPYEACVPIPSSTPGGFIASIMEHVEIVMDPSVRIYSEGVPSGSGELKGWLKLPGDEVFDSVSLQYALDAFPPATFEIQRTGWVPTLSLTTYLRALPSPGPLRVLQRANLVQGQMVDEVCSIWDSKQRLVAQATQLAAIRLG